MITAQILLSKEAIAVYTLVVMGLEKKFGFIKPIEKYVASHKGLVKTLEQDAVKGLDSVLHSPEAAALKVKVDALEKSVAGSEVYKVATAVLHNLSVRVEDLSNEQVNAVALAISTEVKRVFGKSVAVKEVVKVLDEFKSLASDVATQQSVQSAEGLVAPKPEPAPEPAPQPAQQA